MTDAPARRIALVTGASRNIGRAIAVALGAGGADVLVHAHSDRPNAEETAALVRATGSAAATWMTGTKAHMNARLATRPMWRRAVALLPIATAMTSENQRM